MVQVNSLTIKEVIEKSTFFLKQKSFETPRLDVELILSHILKLNRVGLYLNFDRPLQDFELDECRNAIKRRSQGEPVAYILGQKSFCGLNFNVGPEVLIPRPESEEIVETVVHWYESNKSVLDSMGGVQILDLGTGSGCLAISLLSKISNSHAVALDVSDQAIAIAKKNATLNEVTNRIDFVACDLNNFFNLNGQIDSEQLSFLKNKKFQVIVANPPYIAEDDPEIEPFVRKFEPSLALFGGKTGLDCIEKWARCAAHMIADGPAISVFEFGYSQGKQINKIFSDLKTSGVKTFDQIILSKDLSGNDRVIVGRRHNNGQNGG